MQYAYIVAWTRAAINYMAALNWLWKPADLGSLQIVCGLLLTDEYVQSNRTSQRFRNKCKNNEWQTMHQ